MTIKFKKWQQFADFFQKIPPFLISKMTWIFIIALVLGVAYLVYIWYFFVFNSGWSGEKKQAYLNTHGKEITLDEKRFSKVVDDFSKRKENYNSKLETVKDIFRLK